MDCYSKYWYKGTHFSMSGATSKDSSTENNFALVNGETMKSIIKHHSKGKSKGKLRTHQEKRNQRLKKIEDLFQGFIKRKKKRKKKIEEDLKHNRSLILRGVLIDR